MDEMKNIKQLVSDLLNKADTTSNNYVKALEQKQELYVQIQLQIQDENVKFKEYHKMYILNEISEGTYMEQKNMVDSLNEKLNQIQMEIKLIDTYKSEDVDGILTQISEVKPEFNKKYQEEIQTIQQGIIEAKQEYLAKLNVLGKAYDKAVSEETRLQMFLVDFGKQPNMYLPYKTEIIGSYAIVSESEAHNAL